MGIISTLRYLNATRIHELAEEHNITNVTVGYDSHGFYFATGDLPGGKGLTVNDDIPQTVIGAPVAKPAIQHEPKERAPRTGGAVATVHAWLDKHGAGVSRKDAIAALAALGINPSTASVQYGAWTRNKQNMVS